MIEEGEEKPEILMGTVKQHRLKFNKPVKVILVILLALLVGGIVTAGYYYYQKKNETPAKPKTTNEIILDTADDQIVRPDSKKTISEYEGLIKKPNLSADDRYEVLALLGFNNEIAKNYDKALEYFKQAEAIKPPDTGPGIFASMAGIYTVAKNDNPTAISYYEKAIAAAKKSRDPSDLRLIKDYEESLVRLRQ